jgi:predicted dinucleotide-binding enzyme
LLAGMKIAVIGKGNIGGSLGSKWREAGHDVVYGARNTEGEGPGGPLRGANMFFAADPEARAVTEELITVVGLEPAFVGDATATPVVDGLLPLWFALVKQNGGNRRVALRVVSEG